MTVVIHFLLGFIVSFLGSLTPSMLNMSALKASLERGKKAAFWLSIGVSFIVLIQVYIAVFITKIIIKNPMIIEWLEKSAILIFIGLSVYFYFQSKKEKREETNEQTTRKNNFVIGVILSVLNMFGVPFYCGIIASFDILGWMKFNQSSIWAFVIGSGLGTLGILMIYVYFSKIIQQKSGRFIKDINLVMSFLTGIVALITILKIVI